MPAVTQTTWPSEPLAVLNPVDRKWSTLNKVEFLTYNLVYLEAQRFIWAVILGLPVHVELGFLGLYFEQYYLRKTGHTCISQLVPSNVYK